MNRFLLLALCVFVLSPGSARSEEEKVTRMRVDCRFYESEHHFCYASSKYNVRGTSIYKINYGVGCDHETIFNSETGTSDPQSASYDLIRPKTAAVPELQVFPGHSLTHPGTYAAQLDLDEHQIQNGLCHVTEVYGEDPYDLFNFE